MTEQNEKKLNIFRDIDDYDTDQLQEKEIRLGLEKDLDVSRYTNPRFSHFQMEQIRLGLESHLTEEQINLYRDVHFGPEKMEQIRIAFEEGSDITPYIKNHFSWIELREIRLGLWYKTVDVSLYATNLHNWEQMKQVRLGLMSGVDVSIYNNLHFGQV